MKLKIYNERMLLLIDWAKQNGKIRNDIQFFKKIGVKHGINKIQGGVSFAASHLMKAARITGVNIKWLLGISKNMLPKRKADT